MPLDIAPSKLRVEHLGSGILGLGVRAPRLSWRLPDRVTRQEAYQIEINGKPCPRVVSDACVLVPWPGQPVASRQNVSWRVRVWSEQGESPWSPVGWFEAGLLDKSDWSAHWIEPPGDDRQPLVLQKEFSLEGPPARARLYATAHGIYECFLNGQRVGDLELTPGFTSYPTQQLVQVYDVTALLVQGSNQWEVVVSDGWYRGQLGFRRRTDGYGDTLAFLGQLESDGLTVSTDSAWTAGVGKSRGGRPDSRTDRRPRQSLQGVAAGRGESWRRRAPSLVPVATRPPDRARPARLGHENRSRSAGGRSRPEHQRLGAADRRGTRRQPYHLGPRREP